MTTMLFPGVPIALLALTTAVSAQSPPRAPKTGVVIVVSSSVAQYRSAADAAVAELARTGRPARVVTLDTEAGGRLGAVLDADPKPVCLAIGTRAAIELRDRLPKESPFAYCLVRAPEHVGLLDRPKTFGVGAEVPPGDQLALIARALPDCRSVGLLYRSDSPAGRQILGAASSSVPAGIHLVAVAVDKYDTPQVAIEELFKRQIDIVWTNADETVYGSANLKLLLSLAARNKRPVFGFAPSVVEAGALLGLSRDAGAHGRQAAATADRLAAELDPTAAPSPAPIAEPAARPPLDRLAAPWAGYVVNRKVADELAITVPKSVLEAADRVFAGR
jgi:ABC-type uncharacterized transport system substrate-binding protein